MTRIENVRGRSAKAQYIDANGTLLPGASTIADLLGPVGGLGYWGYMVGKSGEVDDYWAYLKGLGSAGSCAHAAITAYATGDTVDLSMYTGREIEVAEGCLEKYKLWEGQHDVEVIYVERPLVSEVYKYGGQMDIYARVDGLHTIVDLKSSDEVRDQHKIQTAGYSELVKENGEPVEQLLVLPLGRDPREPMHKPWQTTDIEPYWSIFKHLLGIYSIQSTLTKAAKRKRIDPDAADAALNKGLRAAIDAREGKKVVSFDQRRAAVEVSPA